MWLIISFDLSVKSKAEQKGYRLVRKELLRHGVRPLQYSVYYRWVENQEKAQSLTNKILKNFPAKGKLVTFFISDRTYKKSIIIENGNKIKPLTPPLPWQII